MTEKNWTRTRHSLDMPACATNLASRKGKPTGKNTPHSSSMKYYANFSEYTRLLNKFCPMFSFSRPKIIENRWNLVYIIFLTFCPSIIEFQDGPPVGWKPFVNDFAGHPVLPTHLPDRIVNVIGRSYTHVHALPYPKWHKTKYTNFMAMNKQREMQFI
jgi:hypothetical protein